MTRNEKVDPDAVLMLKSAHTQGVVGQYLRVDLYRPPAARRRDHQLRRWVLHVAHAERDLWPQDIHHALRVRARRRKGWR